MGGKPPVVKRWARRPDGGCVRLKRTRDGKSAVHDAGVSLVTRRPKGGPTARNSIRPTRGSDETRTSSGDRDRDGGSGRSRLVLPARPGGGAARVSLRNGGSGQPH